MRHVINYLLLENKGDVLALKLTYYLYQTLLRVERVHFLAFVTYLLSTYAIYAWGRF